MTSQTITSFLSLTACTSGHYNGLLKVKKGYSDSILNTWELPILEFNEDTQIEHLLSFIDHVFTGYKFHSVKVITAQ